MEDQIKSMDKRKILLIAGVVIILLLYTAFRVVNSKEKAPIQASNATTVQVKQAQMIDAAALLSFKANLEPVEEAVVSSKQTGQTVGISFENGDIVVAGQVLVTLDSENLQNQLRSAQINQQLLQTTLENTQKAYERNKTLYESGAISKSEFEKIESELKTAQANVDSQQVNVDEISNSIRDSAIRAPISGEIADKGIVLGQYANPGTAIARIKNNNTIKTTVNLKESDLSKVKTGQKVILKLAKEAKDGYEGTVKTIALSANSISRVFSCLVEVNNSEGKIHSGVFGYIEIPDQSKDQILSVPLEALSGSEGNYSVFAVENDIARRRSVDIGEILNDAVEIKSGLSVGESVIITNINTLQDGDAVKIEGQGA